MAFVASDDVHFIAFDLAFQDERLLLIDNTLPEPHGHLLSLGDRQIQLRGDLPIRQVQPHEIEAQHPSPQRPMMPCENSIGQVVETTITITAAISLATDFGCVVSVLDDMLAFAVRTTNAIRPA
jgi:hypothetical protein